MKKWQYSISTPTIWGTFDFGIVEAETYEEARAKSLEKLNYDFQKVNDALDHCDNTKGWTIEFDPRHITLEELNQNY